ncbi:hypothetical protein DFP72DRAFT_843360 [Ephemerocybe angulata]|uniref:Uncharacterized protein n=1 Tax=Ephemerocybe angulata TaxID=980116 RepID=A0A8H6I8C7_9AGAR|nr:hypothetical protein DFP72DRAFT_843360 [Tulosesus angulatus]
MTETILKHPGSDVPIFPLDDVTKMFFGLLSPYIGAVLMETFLYGIYCILYGICVFVLLRKNKALHWVLLVFATLMFSLASADVGYTYFLVFGKLLSGQLTFRSLYPKYVMFVTNGILADSLLMYRCFVVWGRKKRVIFGPFLLLIATSVSGYLFEGAAANLFRHAWVYLAMTFALNIILTILTAGRIWYLRHKTQMLLGEGLLQRYNATLTILVESGVLYSTYMVLDLAFQNDPVASTVLDAGLIQIVGIMPTLIIVQVGLGRAIHDLESQSQIDPLDRISSNKAASASARSFGDGLYDGVGHHHPYFNSSLSNSSSANAMKRDSNASSLLMHQHATRAIRSAVSDATTTYNSNSDLVLDISRPRKLSKKRSVRRSADSMGTQVELRVDTSSSKFTPAPTRRARKSSATSAASRKSALLHGKSEGGFGFGYAYPNASQSRRTLYESEYGLVVSSPPPPPPPLGSSPLATSVPLSGTFESVRSSPPGIVPPTPSSQPSSPSEISRPQPGYFDQEAATYLQSHSGWRTGRFSGRGHVQGRSSSSSFPVSVSLIPSRASSIQEGDELSYYSP